MHNKNSKTKQDKELNLLVLLIFRLYLAKNQCKISTGRQTRHQVSCKSMKNSIFTFFCNHFVIFIFSNRMKFLTSIENACLACLVTLKKGYI